MASLLFSSRLKGLDLDGVYAMGWRDVFLGRRSWEVMAFPSEDLCRYLDSR